MSSLRIYEQKLRDFLINRVKNPVELPAMVRRYSNMRFSMDFEKYDRPHFIIRMGISEAVFDIDSGIIISGGLGPESNDVKNWVNKYLKKSEIKAIWQSDYKNYQMLKEREGMTEL